MQGHGARWWKFDFHTHTPASFDYGKDDASLRETVIPRSWLMDFINQKVECVAVTDHNTGGWIDRLKEEAEKLRGEGENIHVFPGVEISASNNVHVLGIFDPSKNSSHIYSVLGSVKFDADHHGTTDSVAPYGVEQVAQAITDMGGVAIPAHVDLASGLCTVISGNTLSQAAEKINAVEVIFKDRTQNPEGDPVRKLRDLGYDLPEVLGSDSHVPSRVGEGYTWIKMASPCLEGLRLALHDGKSAVIRSDEHPDNPNKMPKNFVSGIAIENSKCCGRADPHRITFHPWMNSIIGGRGSGKSSMLEFLRIGTGRSFELMSLEDGNEIKQAFSKFSRVSKGKGGSGVLLEDTKICVDYKKEGQEY